MRRAGRMLCLVLILGTFGSFPTAATGPSGRIIKVGPGNYLEQLRRLKPGDTLQLAPGSYGQVSDVPGLPLFNLHGTSDNPIVIEGPRKGPPARLLARESHNTIRIANASHIVVQYLELDGRNLDVDAVKAQGISHHITLQNLRIINHGHNQQTVGISTKAPAWNWIVRENVIEGAGTGMYFGSPGGNCPFVGGLIERNLVVDTIGYNVQIKHQRGRPIDIGMSTGSAVTVIRHNVFSKQNGASARPAARPNLLVGHFPLQGPGRDDRYEIYGNFFYENQSGECLFQGEGNIAFYSNILVNDSGSGVCIQPHNDLPRDIAVFDNTIIARIVGIRIVGLTHPGAAVVLGNVVFASTPLSVPASDQNLSGNVDEAQHYFVNSATQLPGLDLRLKRPSGIAQPDRRNLRRFRGATDDFNGVSREQGEIGAYARRDVDSWPLSLTIKPKNIESVPRH